MKLAINNRPQEGKKQPTLLDVPQGSLFEFLDGTSLVGTTFLTIWYDNDEGDKYCFIDPTNGSVWSGNAISTLCNLPVHIFPAGTVAKLTV